MPRGKAPGRTTLRSWRRKGESKAGEIDRRGQESMYCCVLFLGRASAGMFYDSCTTAGMFVAVVALLYLVHDKHVRMFDSTVHCGF